MSLLSLFLRNVLICDLRPYFLSITILDKQYLIDMQTITISS